MAQDQYSGNLACICPGRSNFARKLKVRYTVSEKFQTVSFDLYSSVMGITGLGLVWRAAAKTYDVSALPGEVFLATGLAVFLVLTGIQLLRLVFCRQIILAEWHSRASKNFFCAATISGFLLAMGLL
ncbi:C4-dicarboxylate transporter, partial [Klebsiella quasipneumoniae]